jgi:hypothetical protein
MALRGAVSSGIVLPCRRPLGSRFGRSVVAGKAVAASITGVRTTITTTRASTARRPKQDRATLLTHVTARKVREPVTFMSIPFILGLLGAMLCRAKFSEVCAAPVALTHLAALGGC